MTNKRVQATGLGKSVRTARHAAGLTQGQLGEKAGLHRNAVVAVEDGRGHLDTLTALADVLGLEITGRTLPGNGALSGRMADLRKRRRLSRRAAAVLAGISVPAIELNRALGQRPHRKPGIAGARHRCRAVPDSKGNNGRVLDRHGSIVGGAGLVYARMAPRTGSRRRRSVRHGPLQPRERSDGCARQAAFHRCG